MQFTAILTILAATVAAASPAVINARTGSSDTCSTGGGEVVCCTGLLTACSLLSILGTTSCVAGNAYCCPAASTGDGLNINVDALNCSPITL